jgi:hypothetical protein
MTKTSPFELIMWFVPHAHQALRTHEVPALEEQSAHVQKPQWLAHKAIRHAQHLLTQRRGKNFMPHALGDKVWLEGTNPTMTHPTSKFRPWRYGPFIITKVISNVVYKLEFSEQWMIHNMFHMSLLTLYHETTIHEPNYVEPPTDVIDGEQEWEVEEIIGSRRFGRRKELQYHIQWKGYSPAHNTWEPANNVHAPELVQEFLKKNNNKDKRARMSDDPLPSIICIICIDPLTTSPMSQDPSPTQQLVNLARDRGDGTKVIQHAS